MKLPSLVFLQLPAPPARRALAGLLATGYLLGASLEAKDVVFYVSPASNGVWFGNSHQPSPGGKQELVDSLSAAVLAVRSARTKLGPDSQATIFLRGGTYELAAPLVLAPEDSGLTIAAYRREKPTISGGRKITGWRTV